MATSTNGNDIAIEVINLWKIFSEREDSLDIKDKKKLKEVDAATDEVLAIQNVSMKVKKGEVYVVMGLSGSGKSSLIRCLLRLIEPTSGEIWMNGEEVTALNKQELTEFRRKQAAMVFQHYGLLPHRNVVDNVSFGLKLQGVERGIRVERSLEMIDLVGLNGFEEYFPAQLSGGMQQRVGIARALVNDSPILLMDEPFSGLDPLIRREMQDELLVLQEKVNKTIFFVTHDLQEAVRLGNRMAVMKDGEIVQEGSCQDIIDNPANEYVSKFVNNGN